MAIADDTQLVRMAAPRARPLFPIVDRSEAMTPLVVLLAILPGLYALEHQALSDADSLWGIKSLEILSAPDIGSVVDPGGIHPDVPLKWQPPLASWLTTLAMSMVETWRPAGLVLVSYLSTVGLIGMLFMLCRRLVGSRLAFWTVLLAACHGPLLHQVQTPAPHSLAMLLVLVVFWGYLGHVLDASGIVSFKLLAGGVAWGLCLLTGGPLALALVVPLLVYVLGMRREDARGRLDAPDSSKRVWSGTPALGSLLLLVLTGFAVGGWWILMMGSRHGSEFWSGWFCGPIYDADEQSSTVMWREANVVAAVAAYRFVAILGMLSGPWLFGLWHACREVFTSTEATRRCWFGFLIAWTVFGLAVWVSWMRDSVGIASRAELWQGFVLLPCIAIAAHGIDEISRRRVHVLLVAVFVCVPLVTIRWADLALRNGTAERSSSWWWAAGLTAGVLILAGWWLREYCRDRDHRQRWVLNLLVVTLLITNAAVGFRSVWLSNEHDRGMSAFREQLASIDGVERCTLLTMRKAPTRLRFLLWSLWPEDLPDEQESWEQALLRMTSASSDGREDRVLVVVDWGARDSRPTDIRARGLDVEQVTRAEFFEGQPLRAYVLSRRRR